jgi:predicted alpha/beta-hydrolase family hydrolase
MPSKRPHKVAVRSADGEKELGEVSVSVVRPHQSHLAVVIAHGAGGDMNTRLLVHVQDRLVKRSIAAVRFNFLYTEKGRRTPDRRALLEACWRSVADWVRQELEPGSLFLGGKSMGGRMLSYLVAEGYPCRGVFFLGYPLHPPGKTDQLRKDHLPGIRVPLLFIQGTRDSLCKLELLAPVLEQLGPRASLHVLEGGDHSFNVPKRLGRSEAEITEEIVGALVGWMDSVEKT